MKAFSLNHWIFFSFLCVCGNTSLTWSEINDISNPFSDGYVGSNDGMWPVRASEDEKSQIAALDNLDYTKRLENDLIQTAESMNKQEVPASLTGESDKILLDAIPVSTFDPTLFPPNPTGTQAPTESKNGSSSLQSPSTSKSTMSTSSLNAAVEPKVPSNKTTVFPKNGEKNKNSVIVSESGNNGQESKDHDKGSKVVSINFNNVAMIEYIHFISRISGKNFIFDDSDLQFNVTIVSEEPTTVANLMAALLQELKIRDLSLMEQGNNVIIHRNPRIRCPARVVNEGVTSISSKDSEIVTRVFRLNTLDPTKASTIIKPLLSDDAIVEVLQDSNNIIITDLVVTVNRVADLISTLDSPNSGMSIGQYYVQKGYADSLVDLGTKILMPIAQGNPFVLVPQTQSNSIYIVSNSFIVEKAIAILQNLDLSEGKTKIFSLESLRPSTSIYGPETPNDLSFLNNKLTPDELAKLKALGISIDKIFGTSQGKLTTEEEEKLKAAGFDIERLRNSIYAKLSADEKKTLKSAGVDLTEENKKTVESLLKGNLETEGRQSAIFSSESALSSGGIGASSKYLKELPVGHIERTLFFIYKLKYRKGDGIQVALQKIATSLATSGTANADLISAINSSQWIEASNALIFTGVPAALGRIKELIIEIDIPLRQVFIEMLILDTTIGDALTYSVDWINRFGGGLTTGEQGFNNLSSGNVSPIIGNGQIMDPNSVPNLNTAASPIPVATGLLNLSGFASGVIGTHLTHNGTCFSSIGALVRAVHTDSKANILLNPKIITEDNNPAEVFVGGTDRYKTQSLSNDRGDVITNNFQFIDVGTTLRVTPLIGNNGIITLEIVQERTSATPNANDPNAVNNQDVNLVEVLTKTRAVTKIHVPNGFFVIVSGMIQDNQTKSYSRIPCLGGIPLIGCFGKAQSNTDTKRNLMLFIRPLIIDTDEDYEEVTKRQQDIYKEKCKFRRSMNYEVDEGLNFLNVKSTDPDEMGCTPKNSPCCAK